MQITLNQDEIPQAIISHVKSCINVSDTTEITVNLRTGRGDNGFSATLDIVPMKAVRNISIPAAAAMPYGTISVGRLVPAELQTAKPEVLTQAVVRDEAKPTTLFASTPKASAPVELVTIDEADDVMGVTFDASVDVQVDLVEDTSTITKKSIFSKVG